MAHPTNPKTHNTENIRILDVGANHQVCLDGNDGYIWGDTTFPPTCDPDTVFFNTFGYQRPTGYLDYQEEDAGVVVSGAKLIDEGVKIGLPASVEAGSPPLHPRAVNLSPFAPGQANSAGVGIENVSPDAHRAEAEAASAEARAKTDAAFPPAAPTETPAETPADDAPPAAPDPTVEN